MSYRSIVLTCHQKLATLTLNRPDRHNALSAEMLREINHALDVLEPCPQTRLIVIQGQTNLFCTGTDFGAVDESTHESIAAEAKNYYRTLLRLASGPKPVLTKIQGRVTAGGVGLVAASDYAVASLDATFQLSEIMLGLLPANVLPFLARRTGFQVAYRLALTAKKIDASEALSCGLIDEVAEDPEDAVRRFLLRINQAPATAIKALKCYAMELSPILEQAERLAVTRISELLHDPECLQRISELRHHGLWQVDPSRPVHPQ